MTDISDNEDIDDQPIESEYIRKLVETKSEDTIIQLDKFLKQYITTKGSPDINITDQGFGRCYSIPDKKIRDFFKYLEACRRKNCILNYAELQSEKSGIMLDFDIFQESDKRQIKPLHIHKIIDSLVKLLNELLDLKQYTTDNGEVLLHTKKELTIHVMHISRPKIEYIEDKKLYKDGLHLLIPNIQVSRSFKKYLWQQIIDRKILEGIFIDVEFAIPFDQMMDKGACSVPVLFTGNSKKNRTPYKVDSVFAVTLQLEDGYIAITPADKDFLTKKVNLSHEFSLCHQQSDGLVTKFQYKPKRNISSKIKELEEKHGLDSDDVMQNNNDISLAGIQDPNVEFIKDLLGILNIERARERNMWRNVIYIIANTNINYKPLAVWFSQRCPEQWSPIELDKLWNEAVAKAKSNGQKNLLKLSTLHHYAREDNIEKYREIIGKGITTQLMKAVLENDGTVEQFDICELLHIALGDKFKCDTDAIKAAKYSWLEFVLPDDKKEKGELYKWRYESKPDGLYMYISRVLPKVFKEVEAWLQNSYENAVEEGKQGYYSKLLKQFKLSKRKLKQTTFKNGVMDDAEKVFRSRGFIRSLDKDPNLFGVGNGLLLLGEIPKLINTFHEYAISRYTTIDYEPFDPSNPYQQTILKALRDILVEEDAREFVMILMASCLDGNIKDALVFLMKGVGSNGKSFITMLLLAVLNPGFTGYGKKLPLSLLTESRIGSDKPHPSLMDLEFARAALYAESEEQINMNPATVKEFTGGEFLSGRNLNERQRNFQPVANHLVASNHDINIRSTDHGIWRRIRMYIFKTKFTKNPNPENIYEKQDDDRYIKLYTKDENYIKAFLSILVEYYKKYVTVYKSSVFNVQSVTIDKETNDFRNRQDTVNRFISERVVFISDDKPTPDEIPLETLTEFYIEWYTANIRHTNHVKFEIISQFESSRLGKYIVTKASGIKYLSKHTVIVIGEDQKDQELVDHHIQKDQPGHHGEHGNQGQHVQGKYHGNQGQDDGDNPVEHIHEVHAPKLAIINNGIPYGIEYMYHTPQVQQQKKQLRRVSKKKDRDDDIINVNIKPRHTTHITHVAPEEQNIKDALELLDGA